MKTNILLIFIITLLSGTVFATAEKGEISRDYWTQHRGGLKGLQQKIQKNIPPKGSDTLKTFEAVDWETGKKNKNFGDSYAQRVYGFIIPDKTGEYIFWIACDDGSELKLSKDDNPQNAKKIASVPNWTLHRQWTKYKQQKSKPIKLEAGKVYYIEASMVEGSGGDHLAVAWTLPGQKQNKPSEIIQGKNLKPFIKNFKKVKK